MNCFFRSGSDYFKVCNGMGVTSDSRGGAPNRIVKKKIFILLFNFILIVAVGICSAEPIFTLEARDHYNGRELFQLLVKPHEIFYLQTIHSVYLTPYTHIYFVDEEANIILSGAIFESIGGGFPVIEDGVFSIKNGKFHVENMNRFIGKLRFRVSPISREALFVSGIEFLLYKMVPEGTLIEIRISKLGNGS